VVKSGSDGDVLTADNPVDSVDVPLAAVITTWPLTLVPTIVLPSGLQAARAARGHVSRVADGWPLATLEMAHLLTTELVTNAVLHGDGDVRLTIKGADRAIRVEVTDRNPDMDPMPGGSNSRPSLEGGYGLKIVAGIADDWGTAATDLGKTVWFHLSYT
jgi:anti-sigma regulatory factor (Ser/Thr protein kinase)